LAAQIRGKVRDREVSGRSRCVRPVHRRKKFLAISRQRCIPRSYGTPPGAAMYQKRTKSLYLGNCAVNAT
jgi:hypothetical protein